MTVERIENFISLYSLEINIGLIISIILLFILYIYNRYKIKKITLRYNSLVSGFIGINLEEVLLINQKDIVELSEEFKQMEKKLSSLEYKQSFSIQKIGYIRYNAFSDMGNQLSYSIALMDNYNSGFVLSSLYGRDSTVNYSKPLKSGSSRIPLSAEEQIAIDRALKGENVEKVF